MWFKLNCSDQFYFSAANSMTYISKNPGKLNYIVSKIITVITHFVLIQQWFASWVRTVNGIAVPCTKHIMNHPIYWLKGQIQQILLHAALAIYSVEELLQHMNTQIEMCMCTQPLHCDLWHSYIKTVVDSPINSPVSQCGYSLHPTYRSRCHSK